MKDYYKILQIDPVAEPEVVSAAYRRLAAKYHPDVSDRQDACKLMRELNEAYAVLRDPDRRSSYDDMRCCSEQPPEDRPRIDAVRGDCNQDCAPTVMGWRSPREDAEQASALHVAASAGDVATVRHLIELGANVNSESDFGLTPLHAAATGGYTCLAEMLIVKGALVNSLSTLKHTPLHSAAVAGNADMILLLLRNGADVEAKDVFGQTALHLAAWNGRFSAVRALVRLGANLNATNQAGYTPFVLSLGHEEIARFLSSRGAASLQRVVSTLLARAAGGRPILYDAAYHNIPILASVLIRAECSVDQKGPNGKTAIHIASLLGYVEMVQLLLSSGVDVDARDDDGATPLHSAAARRADIARMLTEAGADVNASNRDKQTPLHRACGSCNSDSVRLLLSNGAKVDARDARGWTPLHSVACYGCAEVARGLLLGGAPVNARTRKTWKPTTQGSGPVIPARSRPLHVAMVCGQDAVAAVLRAHGGRS